MTGEYSERYRKALTALAREPDSSDGFTQLQLEEAESRLGIELPKALKDFYAMLGRHEFTDLHDHLLSPMDIFLAGGHLVFMEENQAVAYWGIPIDELSVADPKVYQTTDPDGGDWFSEEASASDFLTATLIWNAVGTLPYTGWAEQVSKDVIPHWKESWPLVAEVPDDRVVLGEPGQAICVLLEERMATIHAGATTMDGLSDIEQRLGVTLR